MKPLRIALLAFGLLVTCQPAEARPGAAPTDEKVRISDLRLARTPDAAQGSVVFPEDTRELYISFAYTGGTSEAVTFIVTGREGIEAARMTGRYRGDGTATLKLSGADMLRRLSQTLDEAVRAGQANARDAASQAVGTREFLMSTRYHVGRAQQAHDLLSHTQLGPDLVQPLRVVGERLAVLAALVADALRLPPDEAQAMRAAAQKMSAPFAQAADASNRFATGAVQVTAATLPSTGTDPRGAYTLNVEISGDPSNSLEFWVQRTTKLYLPNTRLRHVEPGR